MIVEDKVELVKKRLEMLEQERDRALANYNAIIGRVAEAKDIIAMCTASDAPIAEAANGEAILDHAVEG